MRSRVVEPMPLTQNLLTLRPVESVTLMSAPRRGMLEVSVLPTSSLAAYDLVKPRSPDTPFSTVLIDLVQPMLHILGAAEPVFVESGGFHAVVDEVRKHLVQDRTYSLIHRPSRRAFDQGA